MKYFTKLIRWISSQEHLYFLFALLFIIPNCVFFFTEPLPVTVGIASLLIPLAFWMGVLLVARKPGIVVWCLLPKVILDGGQLVLLYLFGQSVIAVDMYLNLTSSNDSDDRLRILFLYIAYAGARLSFDTAEREIAKFFPEEMGQDQPRHVCHGLDPLLPVSFARSPVLMEGRCVSG